MSLLSCIDRLYLARRYVMPVVQVTAHFNFSVKLTENQLQIALPQLKSSILPQLIQAEIGNIMDPISILQVKLVKNPFSLLSYINLALVFDVLVDNRPGLCNMVMITTKSHK